MVSTRLFGWSRCLALVFVLAGVLLALIPASDVHAAGSSVTNDAVGNLMVFSQDYTGMSAVPGNICLAMDSMAGTTSGLTLSYDGTNDCVLLAAAASASGKMFVGGLSPSLSTTITLDIGMGRTQENTVVNVYAGGAWLAIRLLDGTPSDDLEITSYYYTYVSPTLHSATSLTTDIGFSDSGRFEIKVVSNTATRTNMIYLNGVKKLTTPYTRYRATTMTTVHDPFVNPFVHFDFASIASGQTARLRLYSIEQTVPEYRYVTPVSNPKVISFGVDGPHAWSTVDGGLSLLDGGTIWADVGALRSYSTSQLAALKALIADGFELGIHFSARLTDLSLANAFALMDAETAEITAIFGQAPTSWCSLQGADNVDHADYAYTNLGMVSRNGVNGSAAGLTSIGNLGDNCWTFWSKASAAGIVIPSFSHQLDVTPAITWSISPANFQTFVSNYASHGIQIIGFREYWQKAQNSYHTDISSVVSEPGVSLSFTVDNMGGKSRLLVDAPWAEVVRDGSGGTVPFEVYGSGIVIEAGDGDYTVAGAVADLDAGFSADRTAAVVGQAIQFSDLSTGGVPPLSCEWDFGDGHGSTLQNPSHSYSTEGSFTVSLQVTDSAGSTDTETRSNCIEVNQPLSVTTSPAADVTDSSATLVGYLSSRGSASSVQVSFEWGLTTAYGNVTPAQEMTTTGSFGASLTGLPAGTTCHFRAMAVGGDTSHGEDMTFSTRAPARPWDMDGNDKVDYLDLAILGASYGTGTGDPGFNAAADINRDGLVNYTDLAILGAHYGEAY